MLKIYMPMGNSGKKCLESLRQLSSKLERLNDMKKAHGVFLLFVFLIGVSAISVSAQSVMDSTVFAARVNRRYKHYNLKVL